MHFTIYPRKEKKPLYFVGFLRPNGDMIISLTQGRLFFSFFLFREREVAEPRGHLVSTFGLVKNLFVLTKKVPNSAWSSQDGLVWVTVRPFLSVVVFLPVHW